MAKMRVPLTEVQVTKRKLNKVSASTVNQNVLCNCMENSSFTDQNRIANLQLIFNTYIWLHHHIYLTTPMILFGPL